MPCWIYVRGDEDPTTCNEPADVVVKRLEAAAPDDFIHFLLLPLAHNDDARTSYVRAGDVVQVMPMHPRQAEHFLDDPPDWW
jgi:hypothetical protein